jgi:hypothetical protein
LSDEPKLIEEAQVQQQVIAFKEEEEADLYL